MARLLLLLLHRLTLRHGVEQRIHDVDGLGHGLPVRVVDEYGGGLLSADAHLVMRMWVQDLLGLSRLWRWWLLAGVVSVSALWLMLDSGWVVV